MASTDGTGWLHRLRERGVIRVAVSYAVIAWLLLQIADVTFEPLGVPPPAAGRANRGHGRKARSAGRRTPH